MAGYEQRDNSGSLFKNDKEGVDTRPDYKGSIMVGGVSYWLSAWIKKSQSGTTYMSLSTKIKDAIAPKAAAANKPQYGDDPDDEIPF